MIQWEHTSQTLLTQRNWVFEQIKTLLICIFNIGINPYLRVECRLWDLVLDRVCHHEQYTHAAIKWSLYSTFCFLSFSLFCCTYLRWKNGSIIEGDWDFPTHSWHWSPVVVFIQFRSFHIFQKNHFSTSWLIPPSWGAERFMMKDVTQTYISICYHAYATIIVSLPISPRKHPSNNW